MSWNNTNSNGCPCHECSERLSGERNTSCHDGCEKYKEWRKKMDKKNEDERLRSRSRDTISEHMKREIWKKRRYSRNQHSNHTGKD